MKTKSILLLMLMVITFAQVNSQELPPKHRGMHPRLQADGKVVDEDGQELGYIQKDGKVCDVTGKTIGIIANTGDVTMANGKGIGKIQKDGSYKSKTGHVVTTGGDGTIMAAGKVVGHVDEAYKAKSHACAVHCFFSAESEDANEIDTQMDESKMKDDKKSMDATYVCPMHPEVTSDKQGKCTKCGMDLVKKTK